MIYVVTFLTFHFALVKGAALTDGFNFPHEVEEKELREEDIVKCMDKGDYFMYLDPATNEYLCEELAEKGPCPDNQWFVLDKVNFLEGICKKRDCEEGSVMFKVIILNNFEIGWGYLSSKHGVWSKFWNPGSAFDAVGVVSGSGTDASGRGGELKIPVIDLPNQEKNQYWTVY